MVKSRLLALILLVSQSLLFCEPQVSSVSLRGFVSHFEKDKNVPTLYLEVRQKEGEKLQKFERKDENREILETVKDLELFEYVSSSEESESPFPHYTFEYGFHDESHGQYYHLALYNFSQTIDIIDVDSYDDYFPYVEHYFASEKSDMSLLSACEAFFPEVCAIRENS